MYELLRTPAAVARLGCWAPVLAPYSEVVGYSHLGSIFLRDPQRQEYLVLHPLVLGSNAKRYGRFVTVDAFEAGVLQDPAFIEAILRPAVLLELRKHLGALEAFEVYFPVPYPHLGGSGDLSTYDKGNVWVFAHLVGQTKGIGS